MRWPIRLISHWFITISLYFRLKTAIIGRIGLVQGKFLRTPHRGFFSRIVPLNIWVSLKLGYPQLPQLQGFIIILLIQMVIYNMSELGIFSIFPIFPYDFHCARARMSWRTPSI